MIPHLSSQCQTSWVDLAAHADTLHGMMDLLRGYLLNHTQEENALVPPWIIDGAVVMSSGRARYPDHAIDEMYEAWQCEYAAGGPFIDEEHISYKPRPGFPFSPKR